MSTITVGAGAAGITAGYTLLQEGFNDFIILEASSTHLGRIKKLENFTNFPIDIGAEWIHADPSILTTIVNDANVLVGVNTISYTPSYFEWDGAQLNQATLPRADDHNSSTTAGTIFLTTTLFRTFCQKLHSMVW